LASGCCQHSCIVTSKMLSLSLNVQFRDTPSLPWAVVDHHPRFRLLTAPAPPRHQSARRRHPVPSRFLTPAPCPLGQPACLALRPTYSSNTGRGSDSFVIGWHKKMY
jgi:hypothetical protein